MEIITSAVTGIEKLLTVVNSTRKLLILSSLSLLAGSTFLGYKLIQSNAIVESFSSAKIERVGGRWCYQRKRGGVTKAREIGIQFPLSEKLDKMGIEQNMTGFVINREPTLTEFNAICDKLVQEVLSPERQDFLLRHYPESRQKLLDYYKSLEQVIKDTASVKRIENS